jgi:hypothetical protein
MYRCLGCLVLLAACHGEEPVVYAPSLEFLAPTDGATVTAGDVQVSILVDDFTLMAPEAHNEGAPAGYCELSLDGVVVSQMETTQFTLADVAVGAHTLDGELFFADGDALDEEFDAPVTASIAFTAE